LLLWAASVSDSLIFDMMSAALIENGRAVGAPAWERIAAVAMAAAGTPAQ